MEGEGRGGRGEGWGTRRREGTSAAPPSSPSVTWPCPPDLPLVASCLLQAAVALGFSVLALGYVGRLASKAVAEYEAEEADKPNN